MRALTKKQAVTIINAACIAAGIAVTVTAKDLGSNNETLLLINKRYEAAALVRLTRALEYAGFHVRIDDHTRNEGYSNIFVFLS